MKKIDHPIPPFYDQDSLILILGSFPSVKSREQGFFYGHRQNRFWPLVSLLFGDPVPETVEEKKAFLKRRRIALFDVIRSCEIEGSSDSSIRNVVPNDLSGILKTAKIRKIFCNGNRSFELYQKYIASVSGREAIRLPSTSPANAAVSFDRLVNAWKEIAEPYRADVLAEAYRNAQEDGAKSREADKAERTFTLRKIREGDDSAVERMIRSCLIEFGGNHEGTAWADPDLGRFSGIYREEGSVYYVAENEEGRIVGGSGIGPLSGVKGTCELQKMYCLPEARGTGLSGQLLEKCLDFAADCYEACYLETLENMTAARRFYQKHGFTEIEEALGATGHDQCEVRLIRKLK